MRDFKYFTRLNGLLIYIQEHIELFKQLPSLGLALLGQLEQLKYIQRYPELQLQLVDFIAMQALNTSKQVSQLATEILLNLPLELIQPQLQHFLTSGSVKERSSAVVLLARIIADPVILQQALASETNKTVITTIENALSRLETANIAKQQPELVIPDFEPISDTPLPITARDILQQNFQEFLIECEKEAQEEIEANKKDGIQRDYSQEIYRKQKKTTTEDLDNIFDYLNGKIDRSAIDKEMSFRFLFIKQRLLNLPEFTMFHLVRMYKLHMSKSSNLWFELLLLDNYEIIKKYDLRQIADVMVKLNFCPHVEYEIAL